VPLEPVWCNSRRFDIIQKRPRSEGLPLLALKTITFIYDNREDRILAAVNAGIADSWSCWLTRRMALGVLAKADEFVSQTSKLLQNATAETRDQLMTFEREAALAQTALSLTCTPKDVIANTSRATELLRAVTLNKRGERYEIDLRGAAGGGAIATLNRAEVQRVMQMLQDVVVTAAWSGASERSLSESSLKRVHH
jgi:hypothetical protein